MRIKKPPPGKAQQGFGTTDASVAMLILTLNSGTYGMITSLRATAPAGRIILDYMPRYKWRI
jgi:hypothetical protein